MLHGFIIDLYDNLSSRFADSGVNIVLAYSLAQGGILIVFGVFFVYVQLDILINQFEHFFIQQRLLTLLIFLALSGVRGV